MFSYKKKVVILAIFFFFSANDQQAVDCICAEAFVPKSHVEDFNSQIPPSLSTLGPPAERDRSLPGFGSLS